MLDFTGKVVLVTGAGAGMGRATALQFGRLGAKVAVAEIEPDLADAVRGELEAAGVDCLVVRADVQKTADVRDVIAQIERRFGRLDVLVNNVGDFLRISGAFETNQEDDWDRLYNINLRQMFLVTREAIALMKRSGPGGSIVNLSSIEGYRGIPNCAAYAAFKAGIGGFTKSLALELGPFGIRVNVIAPETTDSRQVPVSKMIPPELETHVERWLPLGRFGKPSDAAGCAVFLASELSAWVTGTTIHLDGGALAAGGWYRDPEGRWTNVPVVVDSGIRRR
jgi:NAD(P)-dependent dehydrogenase (short-subunit alcohol dehydrogenase family)